MWDLGQQNYVFEVSLLYMYIHHIFSEHVEPKQSTNREYHFVGVLTISQLTDLFILFLEVFTYLLSWFAKGKWFSHFFN